MGKTIEKAPTSTNITGIATTLPLEEKQNMDPKAAPSRRKHDQRLVTARTKGIFNFHQEHRERSGEEPRPRLQEGNDTHISFNSCAQALPGSGHCRL
jgi:hypothetical protein